MRIWGLRAHQDGPPCSPGGPATSSLSSTILPQEAGWRGEREAVCRKAVMHPGHTLPTRQDREALGQGSRFWWCPVSVWVLPTPELSGQAPHQTVVCSRKQAEGLGSNPHPPAH